MTTIELATNRSKNQIGYAAPFIPWSGAIERDKNLYPKPTTSADQEKAHKKKFFTGEVDLPDGWWYWTEPRFQSTKMNEGYLLVLNENIECFESAVECREYWLLRQEVALPELIGSTKQIEFGRAERIKKICRSWSEGQWSEGSPGWERLKQITSSVTEAKIWIERNPIAELAK